MSSTFTDKFIISIGFLSLFHAAFSAAQHRSYLRITSQEFTTLPIDILVQGIISLIVVMCGVLRVAGQFKEIRANIHMNSLKWETQFNIPSFYHFNHRGQVMSNNYVVFSENWL